MKMQKVVWYEGMKLDPHHFQQADRYNQYYINSRISLIVECRGIMTDGLFFDMPNNDPLPKSRTFEELFSATDEKLEVFLTIPIEHVAGNNCQIEETTSSANASRYTLQSSDLLDYNTGGNMRSIGISRPNFQFKFGDESLEDYSVIKIGEIVRSSDGKYTLDSNYIVPSLEISASDVLLEHAREILSTLISKSKELRNQASVHKSELSITQVEILLMLQAVNTYIPILNYYYSSKHIHPENLYVLFLSLAGQLSTYSNLGIKTADLPAYDHKHLTEIFYQIVTEIHSMLNVQKTVERKDVVISLRKQGDTLFVGQLSPNQIQAQFYLAVTGDISEKKIISELPKNIKISAYEEIFAVHQAGIQGLAIEYIARPPAGISVNEKVHYFKINKEGRFWNTIIEKNNIAFFIAAEFKTLQMELVLLLQSD